MEPTDKKKCPHCQTDIPQAATKCPACQSDLRSWARRHPVITTLVGLFTFSLIMGGISSGTQQHEKKPEPATLQGLANEIKKQDTNTKLDADLQHGTSAFTLTNLETKDWSSCTYNLNNKYKASGVDTSIAAKGSVVLPFANFTTGDGTRFNIYNTKINYFGLLCKRSDGTSDFADFFAD